MIDFFFGWSALAFFTFFSDVVLLLTAGWGFAQVARAALKSDLRPLTRVLALASSLLVFGVILAKGLGMIP